ncbi:MAG TPA: hypothetical protein VNA04_14650 [Thermoanaerobaculia bacterium]|nr:hypothetical protein [Thermoanaerobaculia bacterium]
MTAAGRSPGTGWAVDVTAVLASVGLAAVLSLAYSAAAGRLLGPDSYSDFAGALALATLLAVALGALTPITAVLAARYVAAGQPARVRGLTRQLLRIALAGGVAVLLIAVVAGRPLAGFLQFRSAGIVAAAVAVYVGIAASSLVRAAIRGSQRFGDYSRNVIAESGVRLLAGVAILILTRSVVLAILAYALGTLVATISGLRVVRRLSPEVEAVRFREVTSMLGATALLAAAMAVFQNVDMLLVKRYFEPAAAGIYGSAAALARTMAVLLMPLEALLIPRLTYLLERREPAAASMGRLLALFLAGVTLPLLLFAFAPRIIVTAIYGRAYGDAAPLLLPLGGAMILLVLAYLCGQVLISMGRARLVSAFAALVVVEVCLVIFIHDSLLTVALILVATRSAALLVMVLGLRRGRR